MSMFLILNKLSYKHSCNRAFFSVEPYKKNGCVPWTQTEFIQPFTFFIDNIYVTFGDNIYHQTLGIPMGTDCAPFWQIFIYILMNMIFMIP